MCTDRTDFDVTTGKLQNQGYFQRGYFQTIVCTYNIATPQTIVFTQSVVWQAILTVNSLEITLILQPTWRDVKIGPARSHGNRLKVIFTVIKSCCRLLTTSHELQARARLSRPTVDTLLFRTECQTRKMRIPILNILFQPDWETNSYLPRQCQTLLPLDQLFS